MSQRLIRSERGGVAILMVLAFMLLGTPLITSALGLADAVTMDSTVKTDILRRHYCALGAFEYIRYLLLDMSRWDAFVAAGLQDSIPCGEQTVTIDVTVLTDIPPGSTLPLLPTGALPGSESGREFKTMKTVQPQTASPLTNTTFNYEINILNTAIVPFELTTIYDRLPAGLSYVPNSSADHPANIPQLNPPEPQIFGSELKWESLASTIASGQSVTLSFQAQGSLAIGTYCN